MSLATLLGKDLDIKFLRKGGRPFKLKLEKFSEKPKTEEIKSHPIGEESEEVEIVDKGWEIDADGEHTRDADELYYETEEARRKKQIIPELEIRTKEVYSDGQVVEWLYKDVKITSFEKSNDGGDKKSKMKIKFFAKKRERVV